MQAVTLFCARFQQLIVWEPQVRTCRLSIAAAERLPGSSAAYFDGIFASSYQRLSDYLAGQYGMGQPASTALAQDVDLAAIRELVSGTLADRAPAG